MFLTFITLHMESAFQDFLNNRFKRITLIGMSGAGKSYISCMLEKWGWTNYSCDYEIGAKYLKDVLEGAADVTVEDISALSDYLGKLGNPDVGGFPLAKFKERQKAYYDAECDALRAMGDAIAQAQGHFVHDSTGSFCEITDEDLIRKIGEQTLFVYLKTDEKTEQDVLRRAQEYPKPLFFPSAFLDEKIAQFLLENGLHSVEEITPDDFSRWVFPKLFEARKPKYQRLADLYGVTIPSSTFLGLSSSEQFLETVFKAVEAKHG